MCAVIFLSKATRLVNARNLSMSAARGETFLQGANASPLAFYTSTQPLLGLKKKMCAVVLPPPRDKSKCAPVVCLTQCYQSVT